MDNLHTVDYFWVLNPKQKEQEKMQASVINDITALVSQGTNQFTVALCLSFTFLWYDMVWYSYAMVCYFYAMLWDN